MNIRIPMNTRIPGYQDTWIHEYKDANEYKDTRIPEYMSTWIHGYMNTRIPGC